MKTQAFVGIQFSPWRESVKTHPKRFEGLQNVLFDENRYVRGDAVHALYRIGTPAAKAVLIHYLETTRWCPLNLKREHVLGNPVFPVRLGAVFLLGCFL